MKVLNQIIVALLFVLPLTACDALRQVTSTKVTSQGSPYELVVVCNQVEWDSELGDTLRTVLSGYIPYLNQEEPTFSVLRILPQSYDGLIAEHRNILEVNINSSITEPSIAVRYDVKASPQVVLTLQAPSIESATDYVSQHRESLVKGVLIAERDRAIAYAKKFNNQVISTTLEDKFDISMNVPTGYTVRQNSEDMLWISKEFPMASQGAIIYSYPADFGINSLAEENLVEARNKFTARVPGPSEGSYMTTYIGAPQLYKPLRINGRLWVEMRGWWDVEGDFMGGPYVSYSTIDEQSNKVFTVDCYVYSPKYGKRNYLHDVESLVYSVKFDDESDSDANAETEEE